MTEPAAACPFTGSRSSGAREGVIALDPLVGDLAGEGAALRAAGPLAPVELPGGVRVWAVTHHAEARRLLTDSRLVKDIGHWAAWKRGEIPDTWPLIGLADPGPSMLTFDGPEHRRLRTLTAQALTPRRVAAMRPRIEEITRGLLDDLRASADADGRVDLKAAFAYPLPMAVIGDLVGVDTDRIPRLRTLFDGFFSSVTPGEDVQAIIAELGALFGAIVAEKRRSPGDDLTSALLAAADEGDSLSDEEIIATVQVLITAGHETTISLIVSTVRALLTHPDQLALVLAGEVGWEAAIEETLRWDAPTTHVLIRFATEDMEVGGTVLGQGDAVIIAYGALGRDERQHGPDAERFDVTRTPTRHLSFGHGPHVCPGAPLSRLEALVALPALFERFPGLSLAVDPAQLRNKPAVTQNELYELPVRLN
ncbi:cytochrome P450 [Streptomyces diacarni]|uniref:Cytochrome P450 n=1 Tax=Streptomyces diacarni TaxID=2800381 RepID=A0A367ETR1_9ACTN|nr:cytochrome P450 [Streptomyces diacarni]RCG21474.1 cytochrome P450 [Streptomyces diacarni]